ncbi:MAG: aldehyde dehydrogenase family protein [Acidimicrobiales bacterium]
MTGRVYNKIYVAGRWREPRRQELIEVVDPTSERVVASVPEVSHEDVDEAVRAARDAWQGWAVRSPSERAGAAAAVARGLRGRRDELVQLIIEEVGSPRSLTEFVQVDCAIDVFATMPDLVGEVPFEQRVGGSIVLREPVGVVGAITPWNYPLLQIAYKVAPAITAGCTVVLKPSEVAPSNAFVLAEVAHECGLPVGVFNLVSGYGPTVGEALASHPLLDMVSFTGSTRAGRRVGELAAASATKATLELGGKSPTVLLGDLEGPALRSAVEGAVRGAFPNSGQNCGALSRLLVPRDRLAEVEQLAVAVAEAMRVGDPSDPGTEMGPLVSGAQRERVLSYIRSGMEEGARLLTGGPGPLPALPRGYFVAPTIFTDVKPTMRIAREEIFGPVLAVLPYEDEDDAVRLANDTEYGLSAAVRGADGERAQRVARRIRAGQVLVNEGHRTGQTPFGGFKLSGYGREGGRYGLEEFTATKALHLP